MKYRPRIYYTETQKALMWNRWQKGDSMHAIAGLFDRSHSSIRGILLRMGGLPPTPRKRSGLSLTLAEREEISRGVVAGHSLRLIAVLLGRAPSTISHEINRNGGRRDYRASEADQAAWDRAHRPKRCKLVENRVLARLVAKKLKQLWSPEQIAGWLKRTYPDDILEGNGQRVARVITRKRPIITAGSLTPYRSVRGRLRLKTGLCLVTGKATLSPDQVTLTLRRWLSATRAT